MVDRWCSGDGMMLADIRPGESSLSGSNEKTPMAIASVPSRTSALGTSASSHRVALAVVTTLFFMWGFVTVLNDVLVPHLKSIFDLSYAKVMLIQFAFFTAYFIFALP